jgi:hypothetical protein
MRCDGDYMTVANGCDFNGQVANVTAAIASKIRVFLGSSNACRRSIDVIVLAEGNADFEGLANVRDQANITQTYGLGLCCPKPGGNH